MTASLALLVNLIRGGLQGGVGEGEGGEDEDQQVAEELQHYIKNSTGYSIKLGLSNIDLGFFSLAFLPWRLVSSFLCYEF